MSESLDLKLLPEWQQEYIIVSNNNPKYNKISNALFIASTFNPLVRVFPVRPVGIMPGAYTAYHFCRKIDDMADGDCSLPQEYSSFFDLVTDLKNSMDKRKYPNSDLGILLRGTIRDLRDYRGFDIRNRINDFLDAMLFENSRRLNRVVSTKKELSDLYSNSFGSPQDIAFISAGSRIRSRDIPELSQAQGRIYAVRDLKSELQKGIIFIPREVFQKGINYEELCKDPYSIPSIKDWIEEELFEADKMIEKVKRTKMDWRARAIVSFLTLGIKKYILRRSEEF